MNLLLFNMVLAIVMDGYSEAKKNSMSADTLFVEVVQIWTRWWGVKRGNLLRLTEIDHALSMLAREFHSKRAKADTHIMKYEAGGQPILVGRDTRAIPGML